METTNKILCTFILIMLTACDSGGSGANTNPNPQPSDTDISNTLIEDPLESQDKDNEGERDNEGVEDNADAAPHDPTESVDSGADGVGNNTENNSDNGNDESDSHESAPQDADNALPTAIISIDKQSGSTPLIVNFDASDSLAGNDENFIQSYLWDFGDGVQEPYRKTQRVYSSAGSHTAQLTVTNNQGDQHSTSVSIEVSSGQASYSVSGTVSVANNTDIDSDINDERSPLYSNDEVPRFFRNNFSENPQIIQNLPLQLVGFLSQPASWEGLPTIGHFPDPHTFYWNGGTDNGDIFQVKALGGEAVTLEVFNTYPNVRSWLTVGIMKRDSEYPEDMGSAYDDLEAFAIYGSHHRYKINLTMPNTPGTYQVVVQPVFGDIVAPESTYKLTIDVPNSITPPTNNGWTTAADFVIGDIIVKQKAHCKAAKVSDLLSSKVVQPLQQKVSESGLSLYRYGDHIIELAKSSEVNRPSFVPASQSTSKPTEIALKAATLMAAAEIALQPCVEYAQPNYLRQPMLTPSDSHYGEQWHHEKINLPDAWDTTTGSEEIKVAIVDTGIILSHPDLVLKHSGDGYDFVSDRDYTNDGDGIDSDPTDRCYNNHGTLVAGVMGASTDNGVGVAGVDWQAKIMSVRVIGCMYMSDYDVAQGILYAAGLENDSGIRVADPADIITIGLGSQQHSELLGRAIAAAIDAGVIVIAAAGNDNTYVPVYPAAYEGVISVAATNRDDERADFSNFGSTIDVAAPGVDILSAFAMYQYQEEDDDYLVIPTYESFSGTSFAAPQVSGVVSLMKSVYRDMTLDDFQTILKSGNITDDLGDSGRDDYFGFGLINAKKAVEYAKQIGDGSRQLPVTPILGFDYPLINFSSIYTEVVISASNVGSTNSTLTISDVRTEDPFVTVTAPDSNNGLGEYTISIDKDGLSPGIYSSSVKFTSNAGETILPVIFRVLEPNQILHGNVGNIYLHLTNIETNEVTKINVLEPVNGEYAFNFPHVAAGKYTLKAGNDLDNNGVLCEGAEGCGHYGGDAETILQINADTSGINFDLRY